PPSSTLFPYTTLFRSSDSVPETSAANSNNGLATDVAHTNIGSDEKPASTDALANNGGPTSVDPGSTTYYQELTTTTTGDSNESRSEETRLNSSHVKIS